MGIIQDRSVPSTGETESRKCSHCTNRTEGCEDRNPHPTKTTLGGPPSELGNPPSESPESSATAQGRTSVLVHFPAKRRGEIAEAAFLCKAASLGFSVAKPWGDSDRYDFMLDNGSHIWRVQVKSAHTRGRAGYAFRTSGCEPTHTYTADEIDFLVAYVVPEDIWYVFPVAAIVNVGAALRLFPTGKRHRSRHEKYREAWCQMACPEDGRCREELQVSRCCLSGEISACPRK